MCQTYNSENNQCVFKNETRMSEDEDDETLNVRLPLKPITPNPRPRLPKFPITTHPDLDPSQFKVARVDTRKKAQSLENFHFNEGPVLERLRSKHLEKEEVEALWNKVKFQNMV